MANDAETNRAYAEWLANAFRQVDWLIPAWLTMGFLSQFAKAIETTAPAARPELLRRTLTLVYGPDHLAPMYLDRYSRILHVRDFSRPIDEAIKAYFSGYKLVAVTALIPVVEGIVRKMAIRQNRDVGLGTRKLIAEFDALVERERNSPNCYGERLVMLECLRDFMRDRFLIKTADYDGLDEFNRHGILHGIYDKFGEEINFFRLITLLDLLCFAIGLIEGGVSCFAPSPTPQSAALAAHYRQIEGLSAVMRRDGRGSPMPPVSSAEPPCRI